jgi:hypothetical protein
LKKDQDKRIHLYFWRHLIKVPRITNKKKKAADLCMLILYPATFLKVFTRSNNLLVESLRSSKYKIISSNTNNLIYSFLIHIYFISVSCFFVPAKNSSTILNKAKNKHSCLTPDFRKNALNFFLNLV